MYFILSKVLLFILCPILWVFAILLIAVITKKPKRRKLLLISSIILLYILANPFLIRCYARYWSIPNYPSLNTKKYSCAIVLGGFSSVDSKGNGYFNGSADRFIQGIRLLAMGKVNHLLITGGNGNLDPGKFREGDWVKTQLQELKVPDSSVLIESASRNTIENAVFSKIVLQKAHLQAPYLLITSDFHMRRALMIFKKEGYDVEAYPCGFTDGHESDSLADLLPDANAFAAWGTYLKELVGYVVDKYMKG